MGATEIYAMLVAVYPEILKEERRGGKIARGRTWRAEGLPLGGWSAPDQDGCDTKSLADLLEEERADREMPRCTRAL